MTTVNLKSKMHCRLYYFFLFEYFVFDDDGEFIGVDIPGDFELPDDLSDVLKLNDEDFIFMDEFKYWLQENGYSATVERNIEKPSLTSSAVSFAKAKLSKGLNNKTVSLDVYYERRKSCFGVDSNDRQVQEACPFLRKSQLFENAHYCGACRCGDKKRALLDYGEYPKLQYPSLDCPKKRPGFSNSKKNT